MFRVPHSDINSLKSGLLNLTGQLYCKKSRKAKVKDGNINLILRSYLVNRYALLINSNVHKMINQDFYHFLTDSDKGRIQALDFRFRS